MDAFRKALLADFPGDVRTNIAATAKRERFGRFVGRLRRALAHAVLLSRPPDLIILDEFQRYRELLSKESWKDPLIGTLLGEVGETRPAVLLLSATPYRLYASRWEETQGVEAHRELFDLLEFLGGAEGPYVRSAASSLFIQFGNALRAVAAPTSLAADMAQHVAEAQSVRTALQALLAPYLSRTEREPLSDELAHTTPLNAVLAPPDVRTFRHLTSSFEPEHRLYALPYWLSVPLPAQALGARYQAWDHGTFRRDAELTKLTLAARNRLALPSDWPHPKFRSLREVIKPEVISLPWTAPSLPWWPVGGAWSGIEHEPKLLLFSRFKATPQSIAALTSLGVEAKYLATSNGYERAWRARRLKAGPGRLPIMALFHPSPLLIAATDPLRGRGTARGARAAVRHQLLKALDSLNVNVEAETVKQRERRRPVWALLSALERLAGFSGRTQPAWRETASTDRLLRALVDQWHSHRRLEWVSRRELDDLVTAALCYPGIAAGRALLRHDPEALESARYGALVRLCWHGLRSYLDNPIFLARLKGGKPAKALPRAVLDGNLESVLDEHFWIRRQSLPDGRAGLAGDLTEILGIASGSFSFHSIGPKDGPRIRVRCHAAIPFGSTDDEDVPKGRPGETRPPRSDEIRKAFNSPFWPHVLATTSVGQEGLDFHTWCRRIAHWDLCSSPLALEQREGRIQRFGGLAIRQHLAELVKSRLSTLDAPMSLWDELEALANRDHANESGLAPWWVLPGATVTRYIFNLPQGRDVLRFAALKEQRLIYRLALGQPNQEDLVEILARSSPQLRAALKPLALDLSAFTRATTLALTHDPSRRSQFRRS